MISIYTYGVVGRFPLNSSVVSNSWVKLISSNQINITTLLDKLFKWKKASIRFNEDESLRHEWLKDFFGYRNLYGEDNQTLKQAELVVYNVLHSSFGDTLKDIFKREAHDTLIEKRTIQKEQLRKGRT